MTTTTNHGNPMNEPDTATITHLQKLGATEWSFVELYDAAIAKVGDPYVRQQLEECQRSHRMRTDILQEEIEDLGGAVDEDARDDRLAMPITVVGEESAIAFLESCEDRALADYRRDLDKLDFDVRDLVEGDLLPEQERTHAIMSSLKTEH